MVKFLNGHHPSCFPGERHGKTTNPEWQVRKFKGQANTKFWVFIGKRQGLKTYDFGTYCVPLILSWSFAMLKPSSTLMLCGFGIQRRSNKIYRPYGQNFQCQVWVSSVMFP